ncbi:hypothetical protein Tco_0937338 [Tanacetum coccineum]|uniref:Synaptobrevin, longin-like domain protein n=1 Tax=Tanacetum coccineum TaxID=301880 RepID=A0ABQ5DFZ3_9ASTR
MRDIVRSKIERELVRVKIHDENAIWNEIGVNAGVSKLMLLSLNLLLPVLVYAARHLLTAVRHKLMLPGITYYCRFAETHNLVAFLEKPKESNGFEGIIDFLNASSIKYALTVNPTVYESCIQQFWATAKAKTVNGERQIQALVDKKKVIITEKSVRSDLMLEDAEGTECLPNDVIFEQLTLMGYENLTQKLTFYKAYFSSQWKFLIHTILQCLSAKTTAWNEFSSTMASAIICLATNQKFNFSKYIFDNMMKNLEGGVKFLMYPRFVQVFLDKQVEGMSKHKGIYVTPSHTKKIFANIKMEEKGFSGRITPLFQTMMKQRKDSGLTEPIPDEATNEEPISTPSYDPPLSVKTAQAKEIASLKKRVKQLEKRRKSRTSGLKRLRKVGSASRVESSNDVSLGAQEDASKQGRKIADLDADAEVTSIDETQEIFDEEMLFDVQDDLQGEEVVAEKEVSKKEVSTADPVTTAGEVVTTASATATVDELTLAHTLIEIKAAKPKAITTAATTITTAVASTRPKAKGIVFHNQEEQASTFTPIVSSSQLPQVKDKGKGKMVEPKKPLKKKDQIALDEELALKLQAEEQAELEKERVTQEEASRALIIKELDSIQAMINADEQLAVRLQAKEQEQFSIEEKSRMLVEMIAERKKFFAA